MLVLLLRALVAPLYLVGTVLLSYLSAVGLSAFLFQNVLHQAGVSFYLPLMVFVLLVALGSDYNIFLMSRVREESEHRPIKDGIRIASGHTGSVITSAGLILAGTFGSMATAPLVVLFQVGVAVAIGVLIDTFVVRSILVPAITTLVGERAWWPSGFRLGTLVPVAAGAVGGTALGDAALASATSDAAVPAVGLAAELAPEVGLAAAAALDGVPSTSEQAPDMARLAPRDRRSLVRAAVALGLAVLVPVTFAGLITWAWQPAAGSVTVHAAVVNADEGTTVTGGAGTTAQLALGREIADGLVARGAGPSGSVGSAVAWTATDAQGAADGLSSGAYAAVLTVPADFSRAIAAIRAGTSGATPAATLHLQTGTGGGNVATAVAKSVSDAITASATRDATASYVEDVLLAVSTTQSDITSTASSAKDVAKSATSLADGASSVNTVSGELVTGLAKMASGTSDSVSGVQLLADGTAQLASGVAQLASGASSLASGASSLAGGIAKLKSQTATLPAQSAQLASGASDVASGAAQSATGAAALSGGLHTLAVNTTGLGSQVQALNTGASSLASGAHDVATGASQAAAAAADVSTGAGGLRTGVNTYTASVDGLAANCASMGGSPTICDAITTLAAGSATLRGTASQVASGATGVAAATSSVASGASQTSAAAAQLHTGLSQLAAGAPSIESGIAQSAAGASALATGTAQLSDGAIKLAGGTQKLADGMPQLADGIAKLSSGASSLSSGASSLASGVAALASGADKLAAGARQSSAGAAKLATGTATAASSAGQLTEAVNQVLDGAKIIEAQTGQLASDGKSLSTDAASVSDSLTTTAGAMPGNGTVDRSQVAARVADPVAVQTTTAGGSAAGIAPLAMVLALWLGALAALLAVPALGRGRRRLSGPLGVVAFATVVGLVAAALMVLGIILGVGLDVARLPTLLVVSLLAAAAFAAIVGALVAAFGLRGWVAALLIAGLGVATAGYPFGVDALPGVLGFLRPILPTSWAIDAIRSTIESASASVAVDVAVLAAWLIAGVLAVLAFTIGATRRTDAAAAVSLVEADRSA